MAPPNAEADAFCVPLRQITLVRAIYRAQTERELRALLAAQAEKLAAQAEELAAALERIRALEAAAAPPAVPAPVTEDDDAGAVLLHGL